MRPFLTVAAWLLCACPIMAWSQDAASSADKIVAFPSKFFQRVGDKASRLDDKIIRQTERYLQRLSKQEDRLRRQLYKHDSAAALRVFGNSPMNYQAMLEALHNKGAQLGGVAGSAGGNYIPSLDTLKTSLSFLQQNKSAMAGLAGQESAIAGSLAKVNGLQDRIRISDQIAQRLRQRRDAIRHALTSGSGQLSGPLQHAYQGYSQESYYYGAQLKSYTEELNNPDKLTQRGLGMLQQSPGYQAFFKSHSELASLFSVPGGGEANQARALAGLQTRSSVQDQLHGKVEGGGADASAAVQQNIQSARTQLKKLQDKVMQAGGSGSSADVPDFRPNTQKTKTLWNRLEYGVNLQSLPSTYAFPATSDFGASVGFRLNDINTLGVGLSYKMSWGRDISHIAIGSEGLGLRSFWDMKIKGSFSASGGFEYNYMKPFSSLQQLRTTSSWTRSGLVGVTKTISLKNRMFSKTKVQLLWDFLSYSQVPKTAALIFRVGYSWN